MVHDILTEKEMKIVWWRKSNKTGKHKQKYYMCIWYTVKTNLIRCGVLWKKHISVWASSNLSIQVKPPIRYARAGFQCTVDYNFINFVRHFVSLCLQIYYTHDIKNCRHQQRNSLFRVFNDKAHKMKEIKNFLFSLSVSLFTSFRKK